jgi:hypothetical protein
LQDVDIKKENVTSADVGRQYEMDIDAPVLKYLGPTTFFHLFEMVKHANKNAISRRGFLVGKNAWAFMQRHLWDIEPEDLDSVQFCVARRQRRQVPTSEIVETPPACQWFAHLEYLYTKLSYCGYVPFLVRVLATYVECTSSTNVGLRWITHSDIVVNLARQAISTKGFCSGKREVEYTVWLTIFII